ncbi:putative F-box-like domain superfamily protein [Helianthus annuus]|nr:putative F-box-like domain superfamily protein [Helianthus annuus]
MNQGLEMSLPDELWRWILELGVNTSCLTYKDLCCISMSCRRLNRLSKEGVLWSKLLSFDFPAHVSSSTDRQSPKSIYQIRFEKDKVKKLLAERRAVLRIESRIHEHTRKLHEIEGRLVDENEKLKAAIDELKGLRRVKEASTALKVWQPEIIHSRQKQIVENCSVPVGFRINALEMEIKLCRQHISGFLRARKDEKDRLEAAKERLSKVKYHPLQSFGLDDESRNSRKSTGKNLKRVKHE